MLKRLSVRNYILIDHLEIEFTAGLGIITGETGAGKSVILGALGLVQGQRSDTSQLLDKTKKCVIEAQFDVEAYGLKDFFHAHELDYEKDTIIRREISPEGKSRAFVNDTPVNLSLLKELSARLIDIHSQHETLELSDNLFQLRVVDAYAKNTQLSKAYKTGLQRFKKCMAGLEELEAAEARSRAEADFLRFQYEELNALRPVKGEQDQLEQELQRLENAGEISRLMEQAIQLTSSGDENILSKLQSLRQLITGLKKFDAGLGGLADRVNSLIVELKDIDSELQREGNPESDPGRQEAIGERLNSLYGLQKKHRVQTEAELLSVWEELGERLSSIDSLSDKIEEARGELEKARRELESNAAGLRKSRVDVLPSIEKEISSQLKAVALPNAVFRITLTEGAVGEYGPYGTERISFLFSANKGSEARDIGKVASGGELSRLMLCIKAMMARLSALPTVIFDEIDTGISGETAARVGSILQQMSSTHQVIAITHLPQIAAKGTAHYLVYKEMKKGQTRTHLRSLTEDERVKEIARMLSGEEMTDAALKNARELLQAALIKA